MLRPGNSAPAPPHAQLKRMPAAFISSVMNRRKTVVVKSETPRLSQSGIEEIRELHDLWLGYAEEVGPNQGKLDREAVIEILAGIRSLPMCAVVVGR